MSLHCCVHALLASNRKAPDDLLIWTQTPNNPRDCFITLSLLPHDEQGAKKVGKVPQGCLWWYEFTGILVIMDCKTSERLQVIGLLIAWSVYWPQCHACAFVCVCLSFLWPSVRDIAAPDDLKSYCKVVNVKGIVQHFLANSPLPLSLATWVGTFHLITVNTNSICTCCFEIQVGPRRQLRGTAQISLPQNSPNTQCKNSKMLSCTSWHLNIQHTVK